MTVTVGALIELASVRGIEADPDLIGDSLYIDAENPAQVEMWVQRCDAAAVELADLAAWDNALLWEAVRVVDAAWEASGETDEPVGRELLVLAAIVVGRVRSVTPS